MMLCNNSDLFARWQITYRHDISKKVCFPVSFSNAGAGGWGGGHRAASSLSLSTAEILSPERLQNAGGRPLNGLLVPTRSELTSLMPSPREESSRRKK